MEFEKVFENWITESLSDEIPSTVKAFSFNLYEPFGIELIGASSFDLDNSDWACDEVWEPKQRGIEIPTSLNIQSWEECLEKMKIILSKILEENTHNSRILKSRNGVALGFVDGDLEILFKKAISSEKKDLKNVSFYQVVPSSKKENDGVAWKQDEIDINYHPRQAVSDNRVVKFELRDISYADFLMTDLGWRLFSSELKEIFESSSSSEDGLNWAPVKVLNGDEIRNYYAIFFDQKSDVINVEDTIFAGDFIVRPCFKLSEAQKNHVCSVSDLDELGRVYVTHETVKLAKKNKVTGISFSKVKTS